MGSASIPTVPTNAVENLITLFNSERDFQMSAPVIGSPILPYSDFESAGHQDNFHEDFTQGWDFANKWSAGLPWDNNNTATQWGVDLGNNNEMQAYIDPADLPPSGFNPFSVNGAGEGVIKLQQTPQSDLTHAVRLNFASWIQGNSNGTPVYIPPSFAQAVGVSGFGAPATQSQWQQMLNDFTAAGTPWRYARVPQRQYAIDWNNDLSQVTRLIDNDPRDPNGISGYSAASAYSSGGDVVSRDQPFQSGMATTMNRKSFTHGRFEARGRLPVGKGLFPALIWGLEYSGDSWFNSPTGEGFEIDGHEQHGHIPESVFQTVHWAQQFPNGSYFHMQNSNHGAFTAGANVMRKYGFDWTPDWIGWHVDGVYTKVVQRADIVPGETFNHDDLFNRANQTRIGILLNLAMYANWSFQQIEFDQRNGVPVNQFPEPTQAELAYESVDVYQGKWVNNSSYSSASYPVVGSPSTGGGGNTSTGGNGQVTLTISSTNCQVSGQATGVPNGRAVHFVIGGTPYDVPVDGNGNFAIQINVPAANGSLVSAYIDDGTAANYAIAEFTYQCVSSGGTGGTTAGSSGSPTGNTGASGGNAGSPNGGTPSGNVGGNVNSGAGGGSFTSSNGTGFHGAGGSCYQLAHTAANGNRFFIPCPSNN